MTNQISFKANFIKAATIQKYSPIKASQNLDVSFVKLDPDLFEDKKALNKVNELWNRGGTFASDILEHFEDEAFWLSTCRRYYALTLQKDKLENLIAEKILGLVEIIKGDSGSVKIKYLQTNPKHEHNSPEQKYKGIGTAMLNAIKSIFPKRDITLLSTESAEGFYIDNGFKKIYAGKNNEFVFSAAEDSPYNNNV